MQNNRLISLEQKLFKGQSPEFTHAQSSTFPSPADIVSNYPAKYNSSGNPNDYCNQASNECAIRMSIALQGAGVTAAEFRRSNRFRKVHTHGSSSIVHQPSAAAVADWLHSAIKYPQKKTHPSGRWTLADFAGKSGIIYFAHDHRGGDRGFGHIDAILNGTMADTFYDNRVVWFWEYSGGSW